MQKVINLVCIFAIILLHYSVYLLPSVASSAKSHTLAVLNYLTGWTLDSEGYHPACYLLLENISGKDLTGTTIRMQGKFIDLHTMEPATAKLDIRRLLKPAQQFPIAVISPSGYELPRDPNEWPVMECKIMIRVGSAQDEGTEYLLVTKVDQITQTQDDAFQKLNEATSYNQHSLPLDTSGEAHLSHDLHNKKQLLSKKGHIIQEEKPAVVTPEKSRYSSGSESSSSDIFSQKNLPGLGNDFWNFEQYFGLPVVVDTKDKNLTWVKYHYKLSNMDVIVASKGTSSKADFILLQPLAESANNHQGIINQAKAFAGTFHNEALSTPVSSVRYRPSGRLEITNSRAHDYKITSFSTAVASGSSNPYILVCLSRLGESPETLLQQAQDNEVLKSLPKIFVRQ